IGPLLGGRLLDAADRADRRGVDQRIDPLGNQAAVGELGEVGGAGFDAGSLLGELGQGLLAAGGGDHPPPQTGELDSRLAAGADAAPQCRSGDFSVRASRAWEGCASTPGTICESCPNGGLQLTSFGAHWSARSACCRADRADVRLSSTVVLHGYFATIYDARL